jgi:hypothetical protein
MLKRGHENGIVDDKLYVRTAMGLKEYDFNIMINAPYWSLTKFDRDYYSVSLNDFLLEDKKIDKKKLSLGYKQHLMKNGYDSINYMNEIEWPLERRWDWIVFDDKQIKILDVYKQK